MHNGKLEARNDFDSFLSSCGIGAICIFWSYKTYFCEMKMYEIDGKQTWIKLQKHTRIGYISKHLQINLNKALQMALKTH